MTALSIVQNATGRLGLTIPSAVFSSTDQQVILLRNLMNQEGKELATRGAWTKITKEHTFTTVAQAAQTSSVPSDFGHFIMGSMWNRNTDRPLIGPLTPGEWQEYQARSIATSFDSAFRFRGTGTASLLITPDPTAGQTVAYEYVSNQWCEASGGTDQSAFAADTDVGLLDEDLITLGVIWRYLAQKGFDYGEAFRTYQLEVEKALGKDGGKPILYLDGNRPRMLSLVADGNWLQ